MSRVDRRYVSDSLSVRLNPLGRGLNERAMVEEIWLDCDREKTRVDPMGEEPRDGQMMAGLWEIVAESISEWRRKLCCGGPVSIPAPETTRCVNELRVEAEDP